MLNYLPFSVEFPCGPVISSVVCSPIPSHTFSLSTEDCTSGARSCGVNTIPVNCEIWAIGYSIYSYYPVVGVTSPLEFNRMNLE